MAKWLCRCGNTIRSSGSIPNPQEWRLIADADLEDVAGAASIRDDDQIRMFDELTRLAYRCESCGRLHVFWDAEQSWPPSVYALEPPAAPHD